MLRIKLACKIACLLSLCPGAEILADTYGEYRDRRLVDVTGSYYLVLRKLNGWGEDPGRGGPVEFELARRREGSPVVLELIQDRGEQTNGEVKVRTVDTLLCHGELQRAPSRVLKSSTGLGFATLDVFGYNYGTIDSNDALIVVSSDGNVLYRKSMIDLFADQLGNFPRTAGGVRWLEGAWIDERRREIVVIGEHRDFDENRLPLSIRVVAFDSGEVREVGSKVLVRELNLRNRAALDYVLELVADLRPDEAKMHLPGLLADDSLPMSIRLRSAVALAAFGDFSGSDLMTGAALKKSEDQSYALRNLPLVVREQAAAILCEAVRRHGDVPGVDLSCSAKVPSVTLYVNAWITIVENATVCGLHSHGDPRTARPARQAAPCLQRAASTSPHFEALDQWRLVLYEQTGPAREGHADAALLWVRHSC